MEIESSCLTKARYWIRARLISLNAVTIGVGWQCLDKGGGKLFLTEEVIKLFAHTSVLMIISFHLSKPLLQV